MTQIVDQEAVRADAEKPVDPVAKARDLIAGAKKVKGLGISDEDAKLAVAAPTLDVLATRMSILTNAVAKLAHQHKANTGETLPGFW